MMTAMNEYSPADAIAYFDRTALITALRDYADALITNDYCAMRDARYLLDCMLNHDDLTDDDDLIFPSYDQFDPNMPNLSRAEIDIILSDALNAFDCMMNLR